MNAVVIVTVVALLQFVFFGVRASAARAKAGLTAPAITGDPVFERTFRVQQNTMELLVVLLPAMWMFAYAVNPLWAAALGSIFIAARFVYSATYIKNSAARGPSFVSSILPIIIMLIWTLFDALMSYI